MTRKERNERNEARDRYDVQTWKYAHRHRNWGVQRLYDAGPLGYCLLRLSGGRLSNVWFDRMLRIKPRSKR